MKKVKSFALALILLFAFVGCAPDLVVKNLELNWDPEPLPPLGSGVNKTAKAEIAFLTPAYMNRMQRSINMMLFI